MRPACFYSSISHYKAFPLNKGGRWHFRKKMTNEGCAIQQNYNVKFHNPHPFPSPFTMGEGLKPMCHFSSIPNK